MITKKEDLLKTYIANDNGKLRDLYLELCESFEVQGTPKDLGCSDASGWKCNFIGVYHGGIWIADEIDTESKEAKQLTIEDLIPQTREVEWVNGLPPVGVECEVRFRTDGDWTDWFSKGKFKAGYDSKIWFSHEFGDCVYPAHDIEFRKPETEAERIEREELARKAMITNEMCLSVASLKPSQAIALYEAGYRKESE